MGRRRQKPTRRRPRSSADIRFTLAILVLGAVIAFLLTVLVGQARAAEWTGAALSGGLIVVLAAIGVYSAFQKRRG